MSRPFQNTIPDAWYHGMIRGRRSKEVMDHLLIQTPEANLSRGMRRLKGHSLKEIGKEFKMKKYSSVRGVIERMKSQISKDRNLRKHVEKLEAMLSKSQKQTPFLPQLQ